MRFRIDSRSNQPIYSQIIEQVRLGMARGQLSTGQRLPTVRRLASELGVHVNTVARAYSELERAGVVNTRPGLGTFIATPPQDDVLATEREARLGAILSKALLEAFGLGYTLEQIEASFTLRLARWRRETETTLPVAHVLPTNTIVAMGSHDLVLDVLAGQLRLRVPPARMVSIHVGSMGGLMALARGEAHLAGCHLLDTETGQFNLPFIRKVLPDQPVVLVNLVRRLQGLMVPRGNPKHISGIVDLADPSISFVNRQWGSGTRVLLDHKLREASILPEQVHGYEREEKTHLAVAAAVAGGSADAGLGILSAARALELDFIPLAHEQYDLAIPRQHYESALLAPVLEAISSNSFQRVVEEMGGYDVSDTGRILAET
ncbi:MAG: substrate-binding domain-containing protein [Chloroflexota bacterium]